MKNTILSTLLLYLGAMNIWGYFLGGGSGMLIVGITGVTVAVMGYIYESRII